MEDFLTPISTRATTNTEDLISVACEQTAVTTRYKDSWNTPEEILNVLLNQPDPKTFTEILQWLGAISDGKHDFNIKVPGPKAAQIINCLVKECVPIFWNGFVQHQEKRGAASKPRRLLTRCLSCIAGLGAIISQVRLLISKQREVRQPIKNTESTHSQEIRDLLSLLENMMARDDFVMKLRDDIVLYSGGNTVLQALWWKEAVSLLAGGKLLSVAAEANDVLNGKSQVVLVGSWLGDGAKYAAWLGRNITMIHVNDLDKCSADRKVISLILGKALKLGYPDQLAEVVFASTSNGDATSPGGLRRQQYMIRSLHGSEQRLLLYSIIRVVSLRHLSNTEIRDNKSNFEVNSRSICSVAAWLAALIGDDLVLKDAIVEWLTGSQGGGIGMGIAAHRAVIAALAPDTDRMKDLLRSLLQFFGDKLYIRHTAIFQQEVNAQVLLLSAGIVNRADPRYLAEMTRSSLYLNAISNRLAASSPRSRFLGMGVGMTFSELVDPVDNRMTFSSEEINTNDGKWYRSLTLVHDRIDVNERLKVVKNENEKPMKIQEKESKQSQKGSSFNGVIAQTSKIISIEEIDDETESDEEDIPAYQKPDSDEEDEDDDPTLIQRHKPQAPVYIRDLISGLRDTENYDRHKLALSNACSLIRRKASFGTEVQEHIKELATILVGLGDKWKMENFKEWRLQAMIAVVVAQPVSMGQWFSMTYFNGDYSLGQRSAILSTLLMGARELGGYGKEDASLTGSGDVSRDAFPSKRLPEKAHKMYAAVEALPVNELAQRLEKTILRPLAAEVADKATGPNALKVRTFSSRMQVEKKRKKAIPNDLAKIVAEGFFFPLTGRWRIHVDSFGKSKTVHSSPFLLSQFLKTLALLLHASGSSTVTLPQMTAEFWDLCLSLRAAGLEDVTVLEALLFSFMTILDINGNNLRRVAEESGKELLETQSWVEQVFEKAAGGSEEGERIRMLAAGVLVTTREVAEKYQRLLVGELLNYT